MYLYVLQYHALSVVIVLDMFSQRHKNRDYAERMP